MFFGMQICGGGDLVFLVDDDMILVLREKVGRAVGWFFIVLMLKVDVSGSGCFKGRVYFFYR